ncbi:MAG: YkgJ family cysteine cluster protein [Desulfobacteraceae bacterium]|nr:YkgJ family cysteine cluster protein [Desulfobacteraceae bacterium]
MDMIHAEEALKNLFAQITNAHLKPDFSQEGMKAALLEIMALAANIVESVHDTQTEDRVDCKAGCSYCCYNQIKLTPAEALLIFSWIGNEFTDRERALLGERIQNNRLLTEGTSLENRVRIKESSPCVFLQQGKCSIYPVRPLICRSWTSYSHKVCKDAFESGNHNAEIETSSSSNFVYYLARETVRKSCRYHGVDSVPLELPMAMDCCFSHSDPFTRWLEGEHLFDRVPDWQNPDDTDFSFMDIQVPTFLDRFSLSYLRDGSCIEYFLHSKEKEMEISTELILSYDSHSKSLNVSKFYPELNKEPIHKYMSAACLFLMIHHAASVFGIHRDSFIFLETRNRVFEDFYSRLKDFGFLIHHERTGDNCNVRGIYHMLPIETSMIVPAGQTAHMAAC